jgi:hypothetical protein
MAPSAPVRNTITDKEGFKMSLQKYMMLISTFLFVFIFFSMEGLSQEKKAYPKVFKGKVVEVSQNLITIGKTTIALPKKIKTLDLSGNTTSFETIKKGDYVSITLEKNEALIRRILESKVVEADAVIPR